MRGEGRSPDRPLTACVIAARAASGCVYASFKPLKLSLGGIRHPRRTVQVNSSCCGATVLSGEIYKDFKVATKSFAF